MEKRRLVLVEWADAMRDSGYYDPLATGRYSPMKVETVGHLIKRNRDAIVIANEAFSDGAMRDIHTIPKKMIISLTYLRKER